MSQINKPPIGLQAFLGSKNFGKNPSELAQTVIPQLDLFPFLSAYDLFTARTASQTITGEASWALAEVPEGELWLLESIGCSIQFNTGTPTVPEGATISGYILQTLNAEGSIAPLGEIVDFRSKDGSTSTTEYQAIHFPNYIPIRSGEQLGFIASRVNLTGAADIVTRALARYYKLRV